MSGYKIHHCNSKVKPLHDVHNWQEEFTNAKAVAWYFDAIVFYNIQNGEWNKTLRVNLEEELVRLRVFDEHKEMQIWRSNGELKGRLRNDSKGDNIEYVEARLIMNGTPPYGEMDSGIIASEKKGTKYEFPYPELKGAKERIALVTRNYIDYNDIGQAGYTDSRFIDIAIFKK